MKSDRSFARKILVQVLNHNSVTRVLIELNSLLCILCVFCIFSIFLDVW